MWLVFVGCLMRMAWCYAQAAWVVDNSCSFFDHTTPWFVKLLFLNEIICDQNMIKVLRRVYKWSLQALPQVLSTDLSTGLVDKFKFPLNTMSYIDVDNVLL